MKPFFSLQEEENAHCSVQVLDMHKDRTAVVRKLEQLFVFGATSDFAKPLMKQWLPHHMGVSFFNCFCEGDLSF